MPSKIAMMGPQPSMMILDECSMIGPKMIAHISHNMSQIMNAKINSYDNIPSSDTFMSNTKKCLVDKSPFGSLLTILSGDFFHLPCIGDKSIPSAIVDFILNPSKTEFRDPTSPLVIGLLMLINNILYIPLTEQVRCAQDARHTSMLEKLRQTSIRYPVTQEILNDLKQLQLSKQRIRENPRFLFATELVLTNRERCEVNRIKCHLFAKFHKRILIKYPLQIVRELQQFTREQQIDIRQNNESTLYGYFVSGMPGMIMENICTSKGITNGTLCKVHTLLFNMEKGTPDEILLKNNAIATIQEAQRNTGYCKIDIQIHPDYMGVELSTSIYTAQEWPRDQTLLQDHIIVPIPFAVTTTKVEVAMTDGLMRQIPIKLEVRDMAVVPGFGATPDKYQGKTAIPLVARIGLNPRRALTLPMLLVILSRVTKGSDLGITPIHDGDDLSHLLKLEWSEDLYLFLNSFHPMTRKISLDLINAAKINYVNQRAQGTTRINMASRTQRESSLLSPSHTPALSRRRRREIEEEDFKETETTNNNTITPQRLQIQRTPNSTRTRQRQVATLMPLQNVPELSRRRPRNYDDEDISSAATTRNPRSRRSHRGINELRPNNLINERHITLNEHVQ